MPTKFKIFAIAAALAASTSSAAMAQDLDHDGPNSNPLTMCRAGYRYYHGLCQWVAAPVAAQAPAPMTTAFDGTYVGVSRTLEGYQRDPATYRGSQTRADREGVAGDLYQKTILSQPCTQNGQPGLLTIAGGVPRYNGSTLYQTTWEGSVNAQGVLVMHAPRGGQLEAQIDGRGTVTGRITGGGCSYHMVWQKEGK